MDVADVAVAMGPRNKRRLSAGAIVVVGAVAIAAAALIWSSHNHSGSATSPAARSSSGPWFVRRLVFGMTPKQVNRAVGVRPIKIQGACWVYRSTAGTYNGLPSRRVGTLWMGQPGSIAARTADAIKLCFAFGVLNSESMHTHSPLGWVWEETTL